ncbi:hypothetical protein HYX10_04885 [Candidatus Woesearchaeota archaeon]|nr:hypothetical protein [Candidatus Woesearchaeota archaeon]
MIKLIKAWKNGRAALIGAAVVLAVLLWPAIPLRGFDIWFETMAGISYTLFLYPILAVLTGSFAVLYIYNKQCKTCKVNPAGGASASIFGVLLGACPACIPAIAFFLPLSVTVTLSYFSWIFLSAAIALLVFSIYKSGGFRRD